MTLARIQSSSQTTHENGVRPPAPPLVKDVADFRRIIIVGAGGFGRELLQWARAAWPNHADRVVGFLSIDADILDSHPECPPVVGNPDSFMPVGGDGFVLGIGIPGVRRRVAESLIARGAEFISLVHPTAIVTSTASLGAGSIVCPHAIVSDTARLGRFTLVNYHASIAHDAVTGDFTVLSPYATLGGGAAIAEDVFLGLHASVAPGVTVGQRCKVAANSCALRDTAADSLVVGVPGRSSPLLP